MSKVEKISIGKHCLRYGVLNSDSKNHDHIELDYSAFFWISSNPPWFCRIWRKDWVKSRRKSFGASYGRNKFEAYRKALKDLNTPDTYKGESFSIRITF